jgi:arylsulfatase A-like enzyme
MKRLAAILLLLIGFGCASEPAVWDGPGPRHVLILSNDSVRADHLGSYGYGRNTTPNIDRIAAKGVRFEHHLSLLGSTHYSLRNMMSGRLPEQTPGATLPQVLQSAGFVTANFYPLDEVPFEHDLAAELQRIYLAPFLKKGVSRMAARLKEKKNDLAYGRLLVNTKTWLTQYQRPLIRELFEKNHDGRIFAVVHSEDGHFPYRLLDRNYKFVSEDEVADERNYPFTLVDGHATEALDRFETDPRDEKTKTRITTDFYDSALVEWDRQVDLILSDLERIGALRDTLVLITSDHGEALLDHGTLVHSQTCYPEEIHVPLIALWQGGGDFWSGESISAFTQVGDLPGSIAKLINVNFPLPKLDLFSATPRKSLKAPGPMHLGLCPEQDYYEGQIDKPTGVLLDGRFLLVAWFDRENGSLKQPELYDLTADPKAKNDISKKKQKVFDRGLKALMNRCRIDH